MKINFQLISMSISIKESKSKPEIIRLAVMDLRALLTQRPGAQAVKYVWDPHLLLPKTFRLLLVSCDLWSDFLPDVKHGYDQLENPVTSCF